MSTETHQITLFHAPQSRSFGALILLEELGIPYTLHPINMKAGEQRGAEYLAINPMGKVPAILSNGTLVTEQPAIYIYLADLFASAGLAPALDDPLRGAYLRWLVFYGSCFEPALVDKAQKSEPPQGMCPYGNYETMLNTLVSQLEKGPYLLGERFSAADVLWGTGLTWTVMFKLVPDLPVITAYIERITSRPAAARARQKDDALKAAQG